MAEATVVPAGDGLLRRLPTAGGQRADRTNGEHSGVRGRAVVDGSKVIPHGRTREADRAATRR
ncbi:hypothetical protein [Streptomyces zaehneri]|uniref:hypothetical protein n=1 Tax=Streptomyces zaehneri TaxID=3051180 RepID=UPI0028D5552A|nr:hypothetical protein [Streptomyces sp. DSM 40713]